DYSYSCFAKLPTYEPFSSIACRFFYLRRIRLCAMSLRRSNSSWHAWQARTAAKSFGFCAIPAPPNWRRWARIVVEAAQGAGLATGAGADRGAVARLVGLEAYRRLAHQVHASTSSDQRTPLRSP